MSAIVIILPVSRVARGDDAEDERMVQELRVALAALVSGTTVPWGPVLVVDNAKRA